MTPRIPEAAIVAEVLRRLGTDPRCRVWRQNTGALRVGNRLIRFGVPGQADITGILRDGRRLEIECKAAHGRQSEAQRNYQRMIEFFGGVYILARSANEAVAAVYRLAP